MYKKLKSIDFFKFKKVIKKYNYNFKIKIWIFVPLIFLLLIIDNVTKLAATNNLELNQEKIFIPHFINFELVFNRGSAYGANANNFILTISIAIIVTLLSMIVFLFLYNKWYIIGVAFIIAGSLSNLINRIWNDGYVTDFLAWEFLSSAPRFIFNLADLCVSIGIAVLIFSVILFDIILDLIMKKKGIGKYGN